MYKHGKWKDPEYVRNYQREYNKRNRERLSEQRKQNMATWSPERKERYRQQQKDSYVRARLACIEAYGGKCACCGEGTKEFLGIDHIFGGGCKERREVGAKSYHWLAKQGFPKDLYQLLCHNCNMAKGFYGKCPHQKENV